MVVLKELIFAVYTLGGCSDPEKTHFNSFHFGWVWWSRKNRFKTVPMLGGCGGLQRIDL